MMRSWSLRMRACFFLPESWICVKTALSANWNGKDCFTLEMVSFSFSLGAIRVALLALKMPSAISRAIEHLPTLRPPPRGAHSAGFFFFVIDARGYIWHRTWTDSLMNRRLIYLLDARPALFRSALNRWKGLIQNDEICMRLHAGHGRVVEKVLRCELGGRALFPFGAVPGLLNLLWLWVLCAFFDEFLDTHKNMRGHLEHFNSRKLIRRLYICRLDML